jgi:Coenzyme PQQ synthesis protein D (PqqD)
MTTTKGETVVRRATAPWRRVGEAVLVAPRGRDDFEQLNGLAAAVWLELDAHRPVRELGQALGGPADLDDVLQQLRTRGLVEEVAP